MEEFVKLIKTRKELTNKIRLAKEELTSMEESLTQVNTSLNRNVEIYETGDLGRLYIKEITGNSTIVSKNVRYLLSEIEDDQLADIMANRERVSYEYNRGFQDGHSRRIGRYMGEENAISRGEISFTKEFYELEEITDDVILSIITYLNKILKETKVYTGNLKYGDIVIIKHEYYECLYGPYDLILENMYDHHNINLNDWNETQIDYELVIDIAKYKEGASWKPWAEGDITFFVDGEQKVYTPR